MHFFRRLFLLILCCLAPEGFLAYAEAVPSENQTHYAYAVLRNGKNIGQYAFSVSDKDPGVRHIHTKMRIKVKLLFVTAYKAKYEATSVYKGGQLLKHESHAIYNKKPYTVFYDHATGPTSLLVNKEERALSRAALTLTPFWIEGDQCLIFVTEKGKVRPISYQNTGDVSLKVGSKVYQAKQVKITGDITRDLWYAPDGTLLKVSYKKNGANITLVRQHLPD